MTTLGFAGLGTTIADLGLATSEPVEVDYAVRARVGRVT